MDTQRFNMIQTRRSQTIIQKIDHNNNEKNRIQILTSSSSSSSSDDELIINNQSSNGTHLRTTSTFTKISEMRQTPGTLTGSRISVQSINRYESSKGKVKTNSIIKEELEFNSTSTSSSSGNEINKLLNEATYGLENLVGQLQSLWLNVSESHVIPKIATNSSGVSPNRILELVGLCSFVAKEMEGEWRSSSLKNYEKSTVDELERKNSLLNNELKHLSTLNNSLEFELKTQVKEKELMDRELKELSMRLAKYQLDTVECCRSESISSIGFSLSTEFQNSENNAKRREEDFDSLMNCLKRRGKDMSYYKSQLEEYDKDVIELQNQIEITNLNRQNLESSYKELRAEYKTIERENRHYEEILKLILMNKGCDKESNMQELLQSLITKLNQNDKKDLVNYEQSPKTSLIEEALNAVQEQNSKYRNEIFELKEKLANIPHSCVEGKCSGIQDDTAKLTKILIEKDDETKIKIKCHEEKYQQLKELYDNLSSSKTLLDENLSEKEKELKKTQEVLEDLQKTTLRQQKKMHDLNSHNAALLKEVQEHKQNMEALSSVVHELRSNLTEQKCEWSERMKHGREEVIEIKEHSKWLQCQIDLLNKQLMEAHEKLRGQERDKSLLSQQVLSAQEERKVVDRKLTELRLALQGDTVLRESLLERNETLQKEITKLRKIRLRSIGMNKQYGTEHIIEETQLSEMTPFDTLTSLNAFPNDSNNEEILRRNRFLTNIGNFQTPRSSASLHSQNERNDRSSR